MSEVEKERLEATLNLGSVGDKPFTVDANLLVTGRSCILGSSGSGKSYAVAVVCEELSKNNIPFAIIDTEGEYSGLKEKYEAIWVGDDEGSDLKWGAVNLDELATQAPDIAPLIVDLSGAEEPRVKVRDLLTALYSEISGRRVPYLVILEEADRFVPQYGERVSIFDEIARRGRKRGLGLMVCSQRPSLVDKNILSQCGNQLVGKLIIQNDLKSVSQFFPGRGLPKQLTSLPPGTFYAMGGFSPEPQRVTIRRRESRHGGVTPTLRGRVVKPFMGTLAQTVKVEMNSKSEEHAMPGRLAILTPAVKLEDVPMVVRRMKSLVLFGKEETVTAVQQYLRPLVEVGVRLRKGVIKKKLGTKYFLIDGVTGKLADMDRSLRLREGFERLLGLKVLHIDVLRELKPDYDKSVLDVASKLEESKTSVGRVVTQLEEKRLVRALEYGRKRLVRRLVDLPEVRWSGNQLELSEADLKDAKVEAARVKEVEMKQVVRGMWDGADLDSFRVFLYPLYRVELMMRRRKRIVWVDGRTARELSL